MSISGQIVINSNLAQTPSGIPGAQPLYTNQSYGWVVAPGTGSNQADRKYVKQMTLSATPTVLDLTNLLDPFGNAISFARVKEFLIVNTSTTSGQVVLLGYATTTANAWTSILSNPGQITIHP